jgi:dTDP-4-dehydrorhamnose 3,5-epimerase-like enzyme
MSLAKCGLIELPLINDARGNLSVIESGQHVPFEIRRVYYTYDVPGGAERGGHGHRNLQQLFVSMAGRFDVVLDDGRNKRRFSLENRHTGLYVCPMMWRSLENFSPEAVCMVLASEHYDESDYFRDYDDYLLAVGANA